MPNSVDGWWTYKNYLPTVPDECKGWGYRRALILEKLISSEADVITIQEASERSGVDDFLPEMQKAGYKHALHKKGRMRCLTFWRGAELELQGDPLCKDRTLITTFKWQSNVIIYVVNVHLSAGPEGARRLRQVHEALEAVRKLHAKGPCSNEVPPVVFCGDFNSEVSAKPWQDLLTKGECAAGTKDPETGEVVSTKCKRQSVGKFVDAYLQSPQPTLVLPLLGPRLLSEEGSMSQACIDSVNRLFDKFAEGEQQMSNEQVNRWLVAINRSAERGSEMRAAHKAMRNGCSEDESLEEKHLSREAMLAIYDQEIHEGKYWGVAHDLWAVGCAEPCLPCHESHTSLSLMQEVGIFRGRLDYLYYSESRWKIVDLHTTCPHEKVAEAIPNEWHPSDHYAIGATLELTSPK